MAKQTLTAPAVIEELETLYDPPRSFLNWKTPLDLLVATILSAQCTDVRVNIVTADLFKKYRTAKDYLSVKQTELEEDIRTCGYYRAKASFIQGLSTILLEKHKGKVPDTMEGLLELPGVGRKTAAVFLNAVHDKQEGIAVDTHVLRLSRRLGLTVEKSPDKVERDLMKQVPKSQWGRVNPLLISHGRAVCTALRRKCETCVFQGVCPSSLTRGLPDLHKSERS